MWVFEETVNGRKLTDIINNDHENVKYLPGHKLPENVVRFGGRKLTKKFRFSHYILWKNQNEPFGQPHSFGSFWKLGLTEWAPRTWGRGWENCFPSLLFLSPTKFIACSVLVFLPGGSDGKMSAYNAGDLGLIPGLGRSSGEGNSNPLQYSCLEDPMDGGAWWATVYGVTKSRTRLSDFTFFLSIFENGNHLFSVLQIRKLKHSGVK